MSRVSQRLSRRSLAFYYGKVPSFTYSSLQNLNDFNTYRKRQCYFIDRSEQPQDPEGPSRYPGCVGCTHTQPSRISPCPNDPQCNRALIRVVFFQAKNENELWISEPKETTNEMDLPLHERLFHAPRVKNCTIPDDWLYPLCRYKVEWMRSLWFSNRKCYVDRHGIDPRDDCSLLIFFSEAEKWCPLLPWRRHLYSSGNVQDSTELATVREDLGELFKKMNHSKYQFMRDRITRLWPYWKLAAKQFEKEKSSFRNRRVKNIFFYMGAFAYYKDWLENAYTGRPLGEMVQWSDLIASTYILGHNITLSSELEFINRTLVETPDKTCASRMKRKPFDLLYTDYFGSMDLQDALGPMFSQYRCILRILDSFGTDAEFNCPEYPSDVADFGGLDIHLRQMLTMFPHSPDNLFLGFAIGKAVSMETSQGTSSNHTTKPGDKPIGLLYAKDAWFLSGRRGYIDTLSKYLEIHGTIGNETETQQKDVQDFVPDYVINHGVMKADDYQRLLRKSKVFIGVGEPYEGPAPLEAISQGCVFINLKLDPPLSRENSFFFEGKPTSRQLASQNPYMETFIGKPYVYTIDVNNFELVESTVKEILSSEAVKPYLPYEWTPKGMLERVNIFTEKMDFCEHGEQWPPLKEMHLVLGSNGDSCKEACGKSGFLCEPSFFNYINSVEEFNKLGVPCGKQVKEQTLHAPSYNPADQSCTFQAMSFLFSCVAKDPARRRLCPCRDYQPQQVAFCKNCD